MARPQQYNRDKVLDAATRTFWEYGYAATSIKKLEEATGLTTGSLYNSFRDKETLFAQCLNHFIDGILSQRIARLLNTPDALEGLRAYLAEVLSAAPTSKLRGCFLLNAHYDAMQYSREIREIVYRGQRCVDEAVLETLRRAQRAGQLRRDLDPAMAAKQLCLCVSGVLARSRLDTQRSDSDAALRAVLALFDQQLAV